MQNLVFSLLPKFVSVENLNSYLLDPHVGIIFCQELEPHDGHICNQSFPLSLNFSDMEQINKSVLRVFFVVVGNSGLLRLLKNFAVFVFRSLFLARSPLPESRASMRSVVIMFISKLIGEGICGQNVFPVHAH